MKPAHMLVEARNVGFTVQTGEVLVDDVTLSVGQDDRLAIIGPNGAGKTTLLRMLAGSLRPTRGEILIDGRRIDRLQPVERARSIAVVGQSDQPDPRLAVIDYVELGRIPHHGLHRRSEERDIVVEALKLTGLMPMLARPLGSLSGGERQRAQLARAIAQQPKVLFLDEPTNHLDPRARGEMLQLVAGLGIAVVSVLHDLPMVTPFATLVAVMNEGRLVALGTPAGTLTQALVRQVFAVDVLRLPHPDEERELTIFDIPLRLKVKP